MSPDDPDDGVIDTATLARIQQLYAAQSHLIDDGHAPAWAATFTDDGVFESPSYPEPVRGTAALTAFAERFSADARARGERMRHVVTNVFVRSADDRTAAVQAYLQIIATPVGGPSRLVRQTTVSDELVAERAGWRIRRRMVARDDLPS